MSTDDRTENERILDAINATIENRATSDQQYYMIGTRQLHRIPIAELRLLRSTYITAVRREKGKLFGSVKLADA